MHLLEKKQSVRDKHNQDIIRRMKDGDPLRTVDNMSSWFPPRPTIPKNYKEIKRIYQKHLTEDRLNSPDAPYQKATD
ncbi:MAG: hypothetical protein OXT67_12930 [Zetaproteobacteria bacterium]|nr:hypothetical protein [Zetaproteobacteria bacterium]